MTVKKLNLKALASAPMAGFRTKSVTVAEWDGATVVLREPSSTAWVEWRQIIKLDEDEVPEKLSAAQEARRSIDGDVVLFIDALMDENGVHVFSSEDKELVAEVYGPVHARLLKQALDLSTSAADAEKKPESQTLNS
ncbi:phage tail assembly chaperone [Serratia fonticola]|uniref:Phage tail protein n=1 Tax=Serratia fonticola TaxID=47917 RepID=A0AAW3WTM5_SERFO|nr:phage tail assembly chaperone [Serratia fonticola]ERK09591.1 Phage tail assembly chaperone [Serratia fonticola AU-P3(3)]MBC3213866.1 phage tail protein [Serratia fonticola]NYA13139.1 phage tail protein [Serratia fonticola]NYA33466.1 phage tail protein [Serratia fonticola]